MKKILDIVMSAVLLIAVTYVSFFADRKIEATEKTPEVITENSTEYEHRIVIDAGHGGVDPGKVGNAGTLEKELNLAIAYRLYEYLVNDGYQVLMTRTDDNGLYEESDVNKKAGDLRKRCEFADDNNAGLMISIHQNSFSSKDVRGSQVFYYTHSVEGKKIAGIIQEELRNIADSSNTRKEKANDSYYLLVHTKCPTVIVECGFLSNDDEEKLLVSEEYQDKLCRAILNGINRYYNQ